MSSASEQDLGNDKTPRSDAKTIRNELTVMRKDGNGRFVVIVAHLETTVTQRSNIDKTKATIHDHDANNTSHNTQLHTRSIFSCVWLKSYKAQVCSVVVNTVIFIFWHATFHAQSSLLDALSRTPPTRTPSLLFPSHGDTPCVRRPGAQLGRLAEQSLLTQEERRPTRAVRSTRVKTTGFAAQ